MLQVSGMQVPVFGFLACMQVSGWLPEFYLQQGGMRLFSD